jgi:hypothetical protein
MAEMRSLVLAVCAIGLLFLGGCERKVVAYTDCSEVAMADVPMKWKDGLMVILRGSGSQTVAYLCELKEGPPQAFLQGMNK